MRSKKTMNKALSWLLTLAMILSMVPGMAFAEGESTENVACIGEQGYATLADAAEAAKFGDEIVMLADVAEDVTVPAGVTFNGNGKQVGVITAAGEITFTDHTKATNFGVQYTNTTINIGEGACLEITGTGRMVIGHGCTFNITGNIAEAKTADVADLTPSLIMPGASFTGAGVTFNVTNAYIKAPSSYCSSSKSASGTFDFNITNSILETAGKLAFEAQSTAATVNFELKDSVLTTGSHLVFGVSSGEVVIDNSNVNVGTSRQIENQSTMTVKNGSVVNGAVAISSNAKNPGTLIVDNATYAVTGEFSGSDLGTGTLIVKNGASFSAGSITNANIQIDATGMSAGDAINNITADLSGFAGTLEVINNDSLGAKIVDGKIVLEEETVVNVAEVNGTGYESLQAALDAAAAGTGNVTVEILRDVNLTGVDWNPVTVSAPNYPVVTVNGNDKTITGLNDMLFAGTWAGGSGLIINDLTIKDSFIVNDENDSEGTVGVGAFIGYPQASATITLSNCHLVDSTVKGGHWTGGLIGMAGGYNGNDGPVFMNLTIKDCSVTGSTITGKGSCGGVIGHGSCAAWTNVVIEDTTVSGNTVTSTGSSTDKAGAVMGTIGAAGQPTTANGETKTGGASVSATVSDNTVESGGTAITTIYGRQGTPTGELAVTGGSYDNYPIEQGVAYAAPAEGYKIVENTDGTYGVAPDSDSDKVAQIGSTKYDTLQAAIDAAQPGATVTLLTDINLADCDLQVLDGEHDTYFLVEDKSVTIDLNEKTISGAYTGSRLIGVFSTDKNGHLTLTGNGTVTATGTVYALVNCFNTGSTITIKNGTYELDAATNCLIFYGGETDGELTVEGGNFRLGNIDDENAPWIFNVVGAGDHHVLIKGGTFNADINRQKWSNEVVVAENCYTVANADGTYTVVKDGAKAYVSSGMTTGGYFVRKNIGYATLTEAITAAVTYTDPHVTLLADYEDTLEITGEVKLHLNGHTIKSDASTIVVDGGNLTIDNNKAIATNKADLNTNDGNDTTITFEQATTEGKIITTDTTGSGEAIAVKNGGTLTLNGGAVESGAYGIYVYTSGGTANINGGSVTIGGTNVDGMTVAVGSAAGSANISGGTFEANGVNYPMYAWDDGPISITGGIFDFKPSSYYVAYGYAANEKVIGSETWYEVAPIEAVAYIGETGYFNIEKAIEAANAGDVITVKTFTHSGDLLINKDITLEAEEGAAVQINGQLQIKADGVTVKGLKVNCGGTAVQINAKDVLIENCEITGPQGLYQSYTSGTVTFKDSEITATNSYAIHFDGSDGGNIVIDNCKITGWTSFAAAINKVTISDTEFKDGNYDVLRFYQNAEVTNTTFPAGMRIDSGDGGTGMEGVDLKFNGCSMTDDSDFENCFPESVIVASDITVDNVKLVREAKIGDTYYETIFKAIDAAQPGETVTILAGDYTTNLDVNKAITVIGEGTVNITGKLNITADGASVKNINVNNGGSSAGYINAKDVLVEGCTVVGGNGFRNCYTTGTVTFKNSTITGSTYGIHFDGSDGGNIVIDNCVITGWTSFAAAINRVTISNTKFEDGNYDQLRFYQNAELTNVEFNPNMTVDFGKDEVNAQFNNCSVSDGSSLTDVIYLGDIAEMGVNVTIDDAPVVVEASVILGEETEYLLTLDEALANALAGSTVKLMRDVTLAEPLTVGSAVATFSAKTINNSVTLDLNGKTITYNSTVQGEAMITNKGTLIIDDSSDPDTGVINYNYTGAADPSYGKGNYTIDNAGTLTVNGGKITIANLSAHAKYPINNNSTTGDAILTINGGHLYNYNTSAIRQFCNSTTYQNSVTINGGLIEGYCAIWVQNPGKNTVNGQLTITGGELKSTASAYVNGNSELKDVASRIYFTIDGEGGAWSEDSAVSITGGIFNENVNLAEEAPATLSVSEGAATFNGYIKLPASNVAFIDEDEDGVLDDDEGVYTSLGTAINAANDKIVKLLADVSEEITIPEGNTVTIDLAGKTLNGCIKPSNPASLTIKNGSIVNTNASYSAIEVNAGELTLTNVNVDSARHAVRIDGTNGTVTATIDGGEYTLNATSGTRHAVNVSGAANVTITGGTFVGPKGTTMDSGSAVCVQAGATVTIEGGKFSGGKNATLGVSGEMTVTGGTFDQDPTAYLAVDCAALPDLNGNYVVGTKPTATVNNLGAMIIPAGDYYIYDGSLATGTVDMPLNFVMQFVADQDAEDMQTSPFANWYADFVITFEGIEGNSFDPAGCYLAGYYGSTESWDGMWVKIPVDGLLESIDEGTRYPVMMGVGMAQTYDYICSGVQAFSCAMYIPENILEANPNLKVNLELNVVDSSDDEKALEALATGKNIYKASETSYTADDFESKTVARTKDANGNVVDSYTDFESALAAACANPNVTRIEILSDIEQTKITNTNYNDIAQALTIGAPEGKSYTVKIDVTGDSIALRVMGNGASLTIEENVTIEGLDVVANGFATTGENMTIDGTLKALSLKSWSSNDGIIVNETGKVWLGYGDGQLDLAYGNGSLTVNGNGDMTEPQFKAGYSGTRGNGNTLNLKDTYFEGGARFTVEGSNGTFNVDNSLLKVSGGDYAGNLTVTSSGNIINLTNGSKLDVANISLGEDNEIKLGAGCSINATTISGGGTITIDATGMNAGNVATITGDASGFTGNIEVINNDNLIAEIDDNGRIVLVEKAEEPAGTITDNLRTLSLDGEIYINQYVKVTGFDGVNIEENGGLLIWTEAVTESNAVFGNEDIHVEGLIAGNGEYGQQTHGIAAKEYADTLYLRVYIKDNDGNYVYSPLMEYSVREYCEGRIANSTNQLLKDTCAELLHYGAAAQIYQKYNTGDLANKNIAAGKAWNAEWLTAPTPATTNIIGSEFVTDNGKTLSLDGAILVNFYFGLNESVGTPTVAEILFWNGVGGELTLYNVTSKVDLIKNGNEYGAQSDFFAAKEYDKTIYACAHFVDAAGNDYYSAVIEYSPEAYAISRIENSTNVNLVNLLKQMVTYGETAKIYFESK